MTNDDILIAITENSQTMHEIEKRVEKLELAQKDTDRLVRSVDRLAQSMENMATEQKRQGEKIDTLEKSKSESTKYWIRTIIGSIATGLIGYLLAYIIH